MALAFLIRQRLFPRALRGLKIALFVVAGPLASQTVDVSRSEQYVPGIWVDPDGCEHWVMDDGAEGFMTPHVDRDGRPVCRTGNLCNVVGADTLFSSGSAALGPSASGALRDFFVTSGFSSFIISGHTDSQGGDAFNMTLSERRAQAVAEIARATGADVLDIRGYGERRPVASNNTAAGMAANRRVEVICVR